MADYLIQEKPRTSQFYLLPKIHKRLRKPPGRLIVSVNDCPTGRISQFVDFFSQPLLYHNRSHLKDTTDFIHNILRLGKIKPGSSLSSMDVVSLYTNIPIHEAIACVRHVLDKYRPGNVKPSNASICELLELVLPCNSFQFNGENYVQISDTAMGTKVSPSLANIFVADFEERFVYPNADKVLLWKRFIDDVCITEGGTEDLDELFDFLNTCHPTIKFTKECSAESVSFLDTNLIIDRDGNLSTDLFTKPTDTNDYLEFKSAHLSHCKKSLPYSQLLRVRRICSKNENFIKHLCNLVKHFKRRGYPHRYLLDALVRVCSASREESLRYKDAEIEVDDDHFFSSQPIPLILPCPGNWLVKIGTCLRDCL